MEKGHTTRYERFAAMVLREYPKQDIGDIGNIGKEISLAVPFERDYEHQRFQRSEIRYCRKQLQCLVSFILGIFLSHTHTHTHSLSLSLIAPYQCE